MNDFRTLVNRLDDINSKINITEEWNKWGNYIQEIPYLYIKEATKVMNRPSVSLDTDILNKGNDAQLPSISPDVAKSLASNRKQNTGPVRIKKAVPASQVQQMHSYRVRPDLDVPDYEVPASLPDDPEVGTDIAIPSKELSTTEKALVDRIHNIEWNNLTKLPGSSMEIIRKLGTHVFHAFGDMEFHEIDNIASFTHNEEDLDIVAGVVRQMGEVVVSDAEIDFNKSIPGYKAHAGVHKLGDQYYMFVKDNHGEYIYTWKNKKTNKLQPHMEPLYPAE